jgi:fumarylpyruvate hydrolase
MSTQSANSDYVIAPPKQASLPIRGSDKRFPVHRIYCIGRNYAAHAVEMGHDPDKEPPFFFQKNPDNLLTETDTFPYPARTFDVHFEVEMVVALAGGGRDIPVEKAEALIWGYAVGLDMTRRDLQGEAKKMGRPWEVGKAFEHSAPCGPLVPVTEIDHPIEGAVSLKVNGEIRQLGDLNQMIWKTPEMIAILSQYFELQAGDIIMTGTPSGVGSIQKGDVMEAHVDGVGDLKITVG